ncbi:MAG: T9SS type A sorting domain-containing protein [Chitinivibrionales bacterium]|nr:T9SS type A sorting domain-containing protein [Chitinivibrionales bacterium]
MQKSNLLTACIFMVCFIAGTLFAQDCPWFDSNNSNERYAVCAEPSPVDIGNNIYEAYEPDAYSIIPCQVGDTVTIKFVVGKDSDKHFFFGHMTRNVPKSVGTDVAKASDYFFTDVNAGHFRNRIAWPYGEEGFRLNEDVTMQETGFSTDYENLVTFKIIVPAKGGISEDNWDMTEYPMWIAVSQYHKDSPLYYCLDATGNTTAAQKRMGTESAPLTVARSATGVSIELPNLIRSTISVNSIDGKTLFHQTRTQGAITIPFQSLASGMYIINVTSDHYQAAQNLMVP